MSPNQWCGFSSVGKSPTSDLRHGRCERLCDLGRSLLRLLGGFMQECQGPGGDGRCPSRAGTNEDGREE